MSEKPMTVAEMARMGGRARAKAHGKTQISQWGKQGGRPVKLDTRAIARLRDMLAKGKSQAECAESLGVSTRTIGRIVARVKASDDAPAL